MFHELHTYTNGIIMALETENSKQGDIHVRDGYHARVTAYIG